MYPLYTIPTQSSARKTYYETLKSNLSLPHTRYTDIYNNPERPLAEEHRDTVLEILSDARVASPLIQTGLYHSKVNPRSYMYVFGHNSKAGEFANVSKYVLVFLL